MAYLVIVINTTDTIADLNAKIQQPGCPHEAVKNVEKYAHAIIGGTKSATVQVTTRSTDPSVSTVGSGSEQETYTLT